MLNQLGRENSMHNKYIPVKIVDSMRKHKKGFDNDVLQAIKKKHRSWQRYVETQSGEKYLEYVRWRNKVTKLTKQAMRDYEKTIAKEARAFPRKFWRCAKSKTKASNYRPVCLNCILCKIQESMIGNDIIAHMSTNSPVSNRQFGFISGQSTILQLLQVIEEWTNILDSGGNMDVCYMDFMKAFDMVLHWRLMAKLQSYGIGDKLLNWIRSFLENRQQRVAVNGQFSSWRRVTSGIPKGSVLAPLLFVIYINDLPDTVLSQVFLFLDDTKMYRHIHKEQDHITFQEDIARLQEWADKWLLKFHPKKCKLLTIVLFDVWCRGLTTCLLHVGPPFGNRFLNNSWAVGLT